MGREGAVPVATITHLAPPGSQDKPSWEQRAVASKAAPVPPPVGISHHTARPHSAPPIAVLGQDRAVQGHLPASPAIPAEITKLSACSRLGNQGSPAPSTASQPRVTGHPPRMQHGGAAGCWGQAQAQPQVKYFIPSTHSAPAPSLCPIPPFRTDGHLAPEVCYVGRGWSPFCLKQGAVTTGLGC